MEGINAVHELRSMPNDLNLRQFIGARSSPKKIVLLIGRVAWGGSLRDNFESIHSFMDIASMKSLDTFPNGVSLNCLVTGLQI